MERKDELYLLTKEALLLEILMSEPSTPVSELLKKLEVKAIEVKAEIDAKEGLVETMAMEGPNQFKSVYYKPTCKFGWDDCINDPAYIYATYPEWYKSLYGDKTPEEAVEDEEEGCAHCTEQCCYYDDEDK
jgi:hypothetical protein